MIRAAFLFLALCASLLTAMTARPGQAAQPGKPSGGVQEVAGQARELPPLPVPERRPDGTFLVKMPLSSLAPVKNHTLRGAQAAFAFSLPVPERWEVKSASVSFSYVNSSSLLPKLSRLSFLVGGRVLSQIELRPESPKGKVEVPIPGDILKTGYNECLFNAVMSYTEEFCEYPNHAALWTVLELETASVEVVYALKPVPMKLSAVTDFLFDSRCVTGSEVNIVLPEYSERSMKQALLASSGVALRMDYQTARTTVSTAIKPGVDNIVIGDLAFVQRLLGFQPSQAQSSMAILPGQSVAKPGQPDPYTATVVLTGSAEGLDKAVRAFSYLSFPFPDTPAQELTQVTDPKTVMLEAARTVSRDKEYTLRAMGYFTKTFRTDTARSQPIDLSFTFPSGLDLNPNAYVTLSLHLNYAPGMRSDSVLTVFINNTYVGGVHFEDVKGGTFLDYRINLPLYAMRKGTNTLTLIPVLNPLKTNLCEFYQTENLMMTLFDDSTLTFPEIPMWVKLPDLSLLYQDAFPYATWPDMQGATLLLGDKDPDTLSAALNLMGQMTQRTGLPPLNMDVSFGPKVSGNVLAVGPVDALPRELLAAAPFSLLPQGQRPYPQMPRPKFQDEDVAAHKAPLWSKFLPFLYERGRKHAEVTQYMWADVRSGATITPGKGFVTQYKAPGTASDTITVFTGATGKDVSGLANRLWEPAMRGQVTGDMAMVDLQSVKPKVSSLEVGENYYIGTIGSMPKLTILVNTYPWTTLGVVLGLLLIFSLAAYKIIRTVKTRRG